MYFFVALLNFNIFLGVGQFQYPRGVEIDNDGRIYVADTGMKQAM